MKRMQENSLKKMTHIVILIISMITLCGCNSKTDLTDEQIESLCEQLAEVDDSYADLVPTKAAAAIHVYGVERDGDSGYVYCYASDGTYVKVNNKAYHISGGNGPEILSVKFTDDDILLLDRLGSVSSLETLEEYPLRYRLMDWFYVEYRSDGFCKLNLEEAEKIEEVWNVEVKLEYCIDIFEDGTYEVWDFPEDEKVTIETGKIEKKVIGQRGKN